MYFEFLSLGIKIFIFFCLSRVNNIYCNLLKNYFGFEWIQCEIIVLLFVVKIFGLIDGLVLVNSEIYINLLRVINFIGYQYIMRFLGVIIQGMLFLLGKVYDGSIVGFDLNVLFFSRIVLVNWNGFGFLVDVIVQIDVNSGKFIICLFQ